MNTHHNINYKNLLEKLLAGTLTEAEKADLQSYIRDSFQDKELDLLMHSHWQELEEKEIVSDDLKIDALKDRIISSINQKIESAKKERNFVRSEWRNYLMRAAAVLFIPLLLGSVYVIYRMDHQMNLLSSFSLQERIVANPGSRVHFVLPDQSEVWLNSGSMLEFDVAMNNQDIRKVKLQGQGYFNVAHDPNHPFVVEIDGLNIKALGTSFDVLSYAEDNQISSTLETGSVALVDRNGLEINYLNPGQRATLDKTTRILTIRNVETQLTTSWKDGKLIFRNSPLEEVTKLLERWYNCKITVDPNLLNSGLVYTATIQDETLGEVIKMIEISTSVQTKIEKREVYIERKN